MDLIFQQHLNPTDATQIDSRKDVLHACAYENTQATATAGGAGQRKQTGAPPTAMLPAAAKVVHARLAHKHDA
jgi:hypothetical protein